MGFKLTRNNTFCINLDQCQERWQKMLKRFRYFGIEVTRFPAASRETDLDVPYDPNLSLAQKCCAQSHINIWRKMVKDKMSFALILEDDATFDKEWLNRLKLFNIRNFGAVFLNASEPAQSQNKWVPANEQYMTAGYIITLTAARIILNEYKDCYYASDWMTSRLQYIFPCYTYFPWLIVQEGKDSFIADNNDLDRQKVVRCLKEINYSLDNYI